MRIGLIIFFITLLPLSLVGQEYGREIVASNEFESSLKSLSTQIETISCDFVQEKYISVLSNISSSKGAFYFKKEQNFLLDFTNPKGDVVVMNGSKFKVTVGGKSTILTSTNNPMMRQLRDLFTACFSGDIAFLERDADVKYYQKDGSYIVVIKSNNKRAKRYVSTIVLQFDKEDMTLNSLKMESGDGGDYTLYRFSNKRLNVAIDSDKFKI